MIVWSGRGVLVPVLTFGALVLAELAAEAAFQDDGYYQTHAWPMVLGFALAAVFVDLARRRLMPVVPDRLLTDETTGKRVVVPGVRHSFLLVPVRFWPALLVALGGVLGLASP